MQKLYIIFLAFSSCLYISCTSSFDPKSAGNKLFELVPSEYSKIDFENTVVQTRANNHLLNVEFVSGGGVAVGDINNDGLQDVFFTGNQVRNRLFLNKGELIFEDISIRASISEDTDWSTGATFVDIDGDGDQDIYVCKFVYLENEKSANQLYINNGDLTFSEKAEEYGIADIGFSTHATFCDFDKDNLIDLYVVNQPPSIPGRRGKISQSDLKGIQFSDRLYKNTGDQKFIDYTQEGGIRNFGFGLSALVGDFNNDTWQDIYVSNDFDVADHLYINNMDGTFSDMIKESTKHITNFSMGSDAADYDNDGHLDIMVVDMVHEDKKMAKSHMTNIDTKEFLMNINMGIHHQYMINTLQRNNGNGTFSELARLAGLAKTGWSWGPLFADFDNDGFKDIFITNGVIRNNLHSDLATLYDQKVDSLRRIAQTRNIDQKQLIDVFDFVELAAEDKMPNYIYKNNGDYTFTKMIHDWGMEMPTTSNGSAYADFDLDGDLDLIINNLNDKAMLFKNNTIEKAVGNFVRFRLVPSERHNLYGAKVTIFKDDQLWQVIQMTNTRGFRSKSEDIVHFGIGDEIQVDRVLVEWQNSTVSILENIEGNQLHEIKQSESINAVEKKGNRKMQTFSEVTHQLSLEHVLHRENEFDDYAREALLPYKMSQLGPCLGVGDVNGDGREDFFLGGSAGVSGTLYIQNKLGRFREVMNGSWTQDKSSEDMDVALVDVDSDSDLDMIIVSGGNEFSHEDARLLDRLYINDGKGVFSKSNNGMPLNYTSGSCVRSYDYDMDGDVDIFIGGRLIPGKYPQAANSHLYENRHGRFIDVTQEKIPGLRSLGLVTDACWTDFNKDGKFDLAIVGEWMPITIFSQSENGRFEMKEIDGLKNSEGWYYKVAADDMDNDGDEDLVVGNLGLNYSYTASADNPVEVFSYDFDRNGQLDIVLAYNENGVLFPYYGKEKSVLQIPALANEFDSYEEFSNSTLGEIYGASLEQAYNLKVKTFASAYVENLGGEDFKITPLPSLAQASSITNILIQDFDSDGNKDLLISGNLYQTEIAQPRIDSGTGLLLKGDGDGSFIPESISATGFFTPHDVKNMKRIEVEQKDVVLVVSNNYFLQAFECLKKQK